MNSLIAASRTGFRPFPHQRVTAPSSERPVPTHAEVRQRQACIPTHRQVDFARRGVQQSHH